MNGPRLVEASAQVAFRGAAAAVRGGDVVLAEVGAMSDRLYKVLVDGKSCHGGSMEWPLPVRVSGKRTFRPGAWKSVDGRIEMCRRGLHLTKDPSRWLKVGCRIFRAQTSDPPTLWQEDKCCVAAVRLLYPIRKPAYWQRVEDFVETIQNVAWLKPDGAPEPDWKLFTSPSWAVARAVARDVARAVARAAAGAAARDAAGAAAGATARAAAGAAAWAAAGAAARAAAWAAAGAAAGAALKPTTKALQASAVELVKRMCALTEADL
jgi:hypothetical protein